MKPVYHRPQKASPKLLFAIGFFAIGCLVMVELSAGRRSDSETQLRQQAVENARRSMETIKAKRIELGIPIDRRFDPEETGMIGLPMSSMTSNPAELKDKQTSVDPQFAAIVVHYLESAGVRPGDTVAIGWSGSFPALNVSVCAAVEAMDLKPIAIASAMSSQYGANHNQLLWIDMEKTLSEEGLIAFRSKRVSVGGAADRGLGSNSEVERPFHAAIERCQLPAIAARRLHESIDERMQVYDQLAENEIAAYINVGGGVASTGGSERKAAFRHGVNRVLPKSISKSGRGVMERFVIRGVPVVHLVNAQRMAADFRLGSEESVASGPLYSRPASRWFALIAMVLVLTMLYGFILTDHGQRGWEAVRRCLGHQPDVQLNVVRAESELAA